MTRSMIRLSSKWRKMQKLFRKLLEQLVAQKLTIRKFQKFGLKIILLKTVALCHLNTRRETDNNNYFISGQNFGEEGFLATNFRPKESSFKFLSFITNAISLYESILPARVTVELQIYPNWHFPKIWSSKLYVAAPYTKLWQRWELTESKGKVLTVFQNLVSF